MNLDNQNLEWKLCEAYFSILEISMSSDISIDRLCKEAKISKEEVEIIIPKNQLISLIPAVLRRNIKFVKSSVVRGS